MPLTNFVDRYNARKIGLDPDSLEDIESVQQPESSNPIVNPTPKSEQQKNPFLSMAQEAGRNVLPGLAGGVVGGLTGGLPGIIYGIGTAILAKQTQDASVKAFAPENFSEEYTKSESQNYEQNPLSSTLGGIVGSGGGLMKPSINALRPAGQGLRNLITGSTVSPNQIAALTGAGLGAGIPTGIRAYSDPNASLGELGLEAVGGLLMNSPTRLGVRVGMHPVAKESLLYSQTELRRAQQTEPQYKSDEIKALDKQYQTEYEQDPARLAAIKQIETQRKDALDKAKFDKEYSELKTKEFENQKTYEAEQRQTILDDKKARIAKQEAIASKRRSEDFPKAKSEELISKVEELKQTPFSLKGPEIKPEPLVTTELGKEIPKDYTGVQGADVQANLDKVKTQAEELQDKFDQLQSKPSKSKYYNQTASDISEALTKDKMSPNITQSLWKLFQKIGAKRNVKLSQDYNLVENGKPISGRSYVREGLNETLAKIHPELGKIDTLPHELFHPFLNDLKVNGSESDKKFVNNALKKLSNTEGFKKWQTDLGENNPYKKLDVTDQAEEFLATNVGEDTIRRILGTDKSRAFKNFYKDTWSHIKSKFGKANEEDYVRIFSNRLINDKPFSGGVEGITSSKSVSAKSQEKSNLDTEQINLLKEYNDLKDKISNTKFSEETRPQLTKDYIELDKLNNKMQQINAPEPSKNQNESRLSTESKIEGAKVEEVKSPQETEKNLPELPRSREDFSAPIIRPEIEKIKQLEGETGPKVAKHFTDFLENLSLKRGSIVNKFDRGIRDLAQFGLGKDYLQQDSKELQNVRDWFWAKQDNKELPKLTDKEVEIKDFIVSTNKQIRDEVINRGKDSGGKLRKVEGYNEEYLPNTIDRKVIKELLDNPEGTKAKEFKDDFVKYQISKNTLENIARENLDNLLKANSNREINIAEQFGPIDKAAGVGIPESWRSKNLIDTMDRYLDRVARRFAYHDIIEKTPGALESIDKIKSTKPVEYVWNEITGNNINKDTPLVQTLGGIVKTGITGTAGGIRDLASSLYLGAQHLDTPTHIKATAKAISNLKENLSEAWEAGRIRRHLSSLELDNGYDDVVSKLRRFRDVVSDVTGRQKFDELARAINYGQGKYATLDYFERLKTNNPEAKKWFKTFGEGIDLTKLELTPEDLKKISGRYVDSVQGTYDSRGLPRGAFEGTFAPYLNLARWNIEKSNNFIKYTVNPALQGDYKPLIRSTLGMVLGGAAITSLSELITKRKQKTAEIGELKEAYKSGNNIAPDVFYKLAGLVSAAGHIGIVGDVTKGIMDYAYGKNRPQVYNNILIEAAENTAMLVGSLVSEINENGASVGLVTETINKVLEDNLQSYRMIMAHLSADKSEDIDRANKMRDLRVYKTLSGEKITDLSSPFKVNFKSSLADKYKKSQDPEEIQKLLPELVGRALERSGDDPEKLKKELSKLKENSYQTMPNPRRWPLTFTKYFIHLKNTQGEDVAKDRLTDYIQKNQMNQLKSDLIP